MAYYRVLFTIGVPLCRLYLFRWILVDFEHYLEHRGMDSIPPPLTSWEYFQMLHLPQFSPLLPWPSGQNVRHYLLHLLVFPKSSLIWAPHMYQWPGQANPIFQPAAPSCRAETDDTELAWKWCLWRTKKRWGLRLEAASSVRILTVLKDWRVCLHMIACSGYHSWCGALYRARLMRAGISLFHRILWLRQMRSGERQE